MGRRSLEMFFTVGESTLDVSIRQILTTEVDPRAETVKMWSVLHYFRIT